MADFVLDSFTGSGSLAAHSGEIGATWTVPGGSASLSGGLLSSDGFTGVAGGTSPVAAAYAELYYVHPFGGVISFGFAPPNGDNIFANYSGPQVVVVDSPARLEVHRGVGSPIIVEGFSINSSFIGEFGPKTTLRIGVTAAQHLQVTLDGALLYDEPISYNLTGKKVQLRCDSSTTYFFDTLNASSYAAPEPTPPMEFWENAIGVQQV